MTNPKEVNKLNQYFHRKEFACQCGCGLDTVDTELLDIVTTVRQHFESPVSINSGCRCPKHNILIGGALHSQHLTGRAADIVVKGVNANTVFSFLCEHFKDRFCFIEYRNWVHVDSRTNTYHKGYAA